jgi:putative ABC transport system substrate-binding protein
MSADLPAATLMLEDGLTVLNRKRVFEFAAAKRLPAISEYGFPVRDHQGCSTAPRASACSWNNLRRELI